MRRFALSLLLLSLSVAPSLRAQGEVRGVLFDSLRSGEPIRNAIVTVDGRPERSRTDGRGRFRFTSLPIGVWTLRYQAPWLDSLALPPLTARAEVHSQGRAAEILLATPSLVRVQQALCGASLDEQEGILRGVLRDAAAAPLSGIFVGAVWVEAEVAASGVTNRLVGTVDTTDSAGEFALCGVPRGTTFMMRAGDRSFGTEELVLTLDGYPVRHLDLVAGPEAGTGTIVGRVVGERSRTIVAPTLTVPGDSARGVRGSETGSFALDGLPPRSMQLFVRAIGYLPRYVLVNPAAGAIDLGELPLVPAAQELSARRITARAKTLDELEFRQREATGNGVFIDEEKLKRYPIISATALANESIGIRTTGGRYPRTLIRRGSGTCLPRFFLDGVDWGIPRDGAEESVIMSNAKRLEVYEAAFMPARYTDFNGCGVVLVWTR